ncbi:GmrSD restriction endonuclease domain-containing protein [Gryllotalpicola kribbensis]|uniref:GmrSD restriction endonuclease domain-containing protein n=1 Tax=Gryllotalpicola kribbensis TaxID=993084 RepID=UPI0031DE9ABB
MRRNRAGRLSAVIALAAALVGGLAACAGSHEAAAGRSAAHTPAAPTLWVATPSVAPRPQASAHPSAKPAAAPGTALALLDALPVRNAQGGAKYQRTADFGEAWLDMDGNGCDTRNDILARDLTGITRNRYCEVLTGTLADPYTGEAIAFQRGEKTSALVQIDHVVPLGDAWQTGAQSWTQRKREQFANDAGNLLAVDQHSNESKGDKDAAAWLPARASYRCAYVARQISVKAAYGLWVEPAEKAAMAAVLSGCQGQAVTAAEFATVPAPSAAAAAASAPATAAPAGAAPGAAAPTPAAPAAVAPRPGEFCSAADHNRSLDGLTCTLYASGTWHWKRG